ncbi:MAG: hypothetical protein JW870_13385, partial [Candidatus Delongbacteria bacterium]|nr:hypothetical protein [Candidatus Delongbacteria bacterium]
MKKIILTFFIVLNVSCAFSQNHEIEQIKIREDLNEILSDLSQNYIYLQEKNVDLNCIREYYEKQIPN